MPGSKYEIFVNLSPNKEGIGAENEGLQLRQAITSVEIIPPIPRDLAAKVCAGIGDFFDAIIAEIPNSKGHKVDIVPSALSDLGSMVNTVIDIYGSPFSTGTAQENQGEAAILAQNVKKILSPSGNAIAN